MRLEIVVVLAWIGRLPVQDLEKVEEPRGEEGAERGTEPVDPVVAGEGVVDDVRAEGAGRVDAGAGVVDAWRVWVWLDGCGVCCVRDRGDGGVGCR